MYKNINKKTVAIIEARIGSSRLPEKVLMDIEGKPMLWHILNRLKFSEKFDDIILAIPNTKENDILEKFAKENNLKYFRGKECDVLSRYYEAAKRFKCDIVVRVTADNPLLDPQIVDLIIEKHLNSGADYTSNNLKRTFPIGLDIEVFNFKILETAFKEAKESYQREHVTSYIREHPEEFYLINVENNEDLSYMRWTVDEIKDLEFVRQIYKGLYREKKIFLMKDILAFLKQHPKLMEINKNVKQKESKKTDSRNQ